jgi:uncharacterized repeat protein (TIGR01451 family)
MKFKTLALAVTATVASFSAAAETTYNLDISNTAQLSYSINGTSISAPDAIAVFKVDRRVKFTMSNSSSEDISIEAGKTASTTYTLTNDSNAPIDYKLTAPASGSGITYTIKHPTDNTQDIEIDSSTTDVDLLTISLTQGDGDDLTLDDKRSIIVTVTAPDNATNTTEITSSLKVVAVEPSNESLFSAGVVITKGEIIIPTPTADSWEENVLQTVVAPSLIDENTITITDDQKFVVDAADISLTKLVSVISDPINDTTNPKAIPGAIVQYTLTIVNKGSLPASGISITDIVPAQFNLADNFSEVYKIGSVVIVAGTPATTGEELAISDNTLTFSKLSVLADTDPSPTVNAETIITFTVQLP